ncbi:hypothetical protein D9M71_163810 [compost metagenome]
METDVIAQRLDLGEGELLVRDFGFLQADDVWLMFFDQRRQLMGPGPQAVDIERNDFHGGSPGKSGMLADITCARQRGASRYRLLTSDRELYRWAIACSKAPLWKVRCQTSSGGKIAEVLFDARNVYCNG